MSIAHSAMTGSELHEPKGADSAVGGSVYVTDGLGSGSWSKRRLAITLSTADISTADNIYFAIPFSGSLVRLVSCVGGAASGTDSTLTLFDSGGASLASLTLDSTGAAGNIVTTSSFSSSVSQDDLVRLNWDGNLSNADEAVFTLILETND